jgi:hypothetical protein
MSSDEDEDLRLAIAMSLQTEHSKGDAQPAEGAKLTGGSGASDQTSTSENSRKATFMLGGLDRKKMEEERLARLAKRKQESFPIAPSKRPKADDNVASLGGQSGKDSAHALEYPTGRIKKTWCFGHERRNDVKIEEVLQKTDLRIAVLSAFDWDLEWLFRKIDITSTKLVLIMQAKGASTVRDALPGDT